MARFEGFDFYDIDALLTEEERMIRDTVRDWVEDRVMPLVGEAYVQRRFPRELIPEMGEMEMLGAKPSWSKTQMRVRRSAWRNDSGVHPVSSGR